MLITTFTEKAADELVGRVRGKLLEKDMTEQARKLPLARIGTVNSICDGLVREFAYELGLSPAVEVASEARAATLLQEAMHHVRSIVHAHPQYQWNGNQVGKVELQPDPAHPSQHPDQAQGRG